VPLFCEQWWKADARASMPLLCQQWRARAEGSRSGSVILVILSGAKNLERVADCAHPTRERLRVWSAVRSKAIPF